MKLEYFLWALAFIGVIATYGGGKIAGLVTKDEKVQRSVTMICKFAGVVVAAGAIVILYLRGNLN